MAVTVYLGENMKKVIAPCYKCEERHIGCHGTCERYIAYSQNMAQIKNNKIESSKRDYLDVILSPSERKRRKVNGSKS